MLIFYLPIYKSFQLIFLILNSKLKSLIFFHLILILSTENFFNQLNPSFKDFLVISLHEDMELVIRVEFYSLSLATSFSSYTNFTSWSGF